MTDKYFNFYGKHAQMENIDMFIEYLSRKRGSLKAWTGKLLMQMVTVMLLVGMTMAGNVQAASSCDVVKSGLVACYPFDGNANDGSGNESHSTEYGNIQYVDGVINQSKVFTTFTNNQENIGYVTVPNTAIYEDNEFSISLWWIPPEGISPDAPLNHYNILRLEANPFVYGPYLDLTTSTKRLSVRLRGNTLNYYTTDPNAFLNSKELVANFKSPFLITLVYRKNQLSLYVNSELYTNYVITGFFLPTSYLKAAQTIRIGGDQVSHGGYPLYGSIDDLRIYNRALTEAEIQTLYQLKDSPPKTCEHAVYSNTNNIGKLVIPFVDVPLLNLYTHLPTGELAVFSGELKQVGSSTDFGLISSKLKLIFLTPAHDPCHALYDETQKTLHVPFVDVGNEVYDVKFQHLKDIPLELGVFHLESYDLVQ